MDKVVSLHEQIEVVKNGQLKKSDLVKTVYEIANETGGKFEDWSERTDFIALTKILDLSKDKLIQSALKQAYIDSAIMPPHFGDNIDIGLLEFIDGMKELGVSNNKISDYITETLEYRVVEGMGFDGCLECVAIPFVKKEPTKTKIKEKLYKLQRESTTIESNPNSTYKSSWNEGKARDIEELFRDYKESLYRLARINEEIDNNFDFLKVSDWRRKAKVEIDRFKEEIRPERLSDEGEEGRYKRLLIKQQQLINNIPYREGRDRAMQLAWLDIVLDSDFTGATGKNAAYCSGLYRRMFDVAKIIEAPVKVISQIEATAKERYNLDL